MADSADSIEKMYGPTVIMDRYGKKKQKMVRKRLGHKTKAAGNPDEPEAAQKQAARVQPPGRPLERWGDREVEITVEDVAQAIREWDERVPEASGALMAGSGG